MTLYFDEIEVAINKEPFYIDIEVDITSFPVPPRLFGLPEDCDDGAPGDYDVKVKLSPDIHPYLSTLVIPQLEAEVYNAAVEWCQKNEEKIWKKAEENNQDF